MNRLDRALAYLAPGVAAKRLHARARMMAIRQLMAYYDGADLGRRGATIRRSGASADAVTARTLPALRNGSRDLVRNNPHAKRAVEAIVSNVVGSGITPRFKRGRSTARRLERLARRTLDRKVIDYLGQQDYYGLTSTAMQTVVESGEALALRHWVDDEFPMRIQILEPDYLDTSRDTPRTPSGGRIIQGVQFDARGRREGYWIFDEHPGSGRLGSVSSHLVPARDVAHVYRIDRAGQVRGIPWAAPVMLRLADFDDYENAQLVRQKIAACYTVIYTDGIGGGPGPQGQTPPEKVEPGLVLRLGAPGSDIKFGTPPPVNDYQSYSYVSLHAIAAGFGVSYEALTGDLRGVNFASGKMGRLEFQRNIERWQWLILIPQFCDVVIGWWLEAAELTGINVRDVEVRHGPPAPEMIAPEREAPAITAMLRSGQKTLTQMAAERGQDVEELLDEIQETNRMLDERGIVLDSDPRKVSAAGLTQARSGESLTFPATGDPDEAEQPPEEVEP